MFSNQFSRMAAILLALGGTAAFAGDACKNVKIQFKNQRSHTIRVYKFDYFNTANNNTQTEDVANRECAPGSTCTTTGDNLRDSEGEDLTNFVLWFNEREDDGDWSSTNFKTQPKVPVTRKCTADMTYKGSPVWTINP